MYNASNFHKAMQAPPTSMQTDATIDLRCPTSLALDLFGDRWTLLVIRDLMFLGKCRYGEFLASPEGISTNILADRLKKLLQQGLIEKFPDPDSARTAVYLLTESGLGLYPIMLEIMRWGIRSDPRARVTPEVEQAIKEGGDTLPLTLLERNRAERAALQSRS
ncbi:MAG: helix-turn-helix domain-containing protein [Pseudomonadota bacterium]